MKLWSVQPFSQINNLFTDGKIVTDWQFIDDSSRKAYFYMIERMRHAGINIGSNSPVWAFHSCYEFQAPPSGEVIDMIFPQITHGELFILELDYSRNDFLLSKYNAWCSDIYFPCFDNVSNFCSHELGKIMSNVFDINTYDEIIQACIPAIYLKDVNNISSISQRRPSSG
ncbi:hypothetical protein VBY78_003955 [Enterobacter bugandensis]|nr:hypothetical protein [Enterobacter bugandensis]